MQVQATFLLQFITVVECRLRQAHRRGFWASHSVRSPMRLVPVLEELLSSRARIHRLLLVVRPSYPTLTPCRLLRILLGGGLCLLLADLTSPALVPHSIDSKSLILYGGGGRVDKLLACPSLSPTVGEDTSGKIPPVLRADSPVLCRKAPSVPLPLTAILISVL